MRTLSTAMAVIAAAIVSQTAYCAAQKGPHLEKRGAATQLIVKDRPFLCLAGELAGSSATSAEYMKPFWQKIEDAGFNTVLATVYWDQMEPEKGVYDFSRVDDLIENARAHDLHLVLLWFASWKNGITSHTPMWIKRDCDTYRLAQTRDGDPLLILSTFCQANWEADASAFAALMGHIKDVDSEEQTVIMMQVENEMGLHGNTRDWSESAQAAFSSDVPKELINYLKKNRKNLIPETLEAWSANGFRERGTWEEVFGKGDLTDEMFMAWHYASYMEHVCAAGKQAYDIPYFVNTWLVQPTDRHPGDYPSGGPQPQNHEMWRAAAPHVDILAPDIYLHDFPNILRRFMRAGNPGFIPESSAGINGAANAAFAFGEMGAIGYSPFGFNRRVFTAPDAEQFTSFYHTVSPMMDQITKAQAEGRISGIWLTSTTTGRKPGDYSPAVLSDERTMGGWRFSLEMNQTPEQGDGAPDYGYAIIIQDSEDEFTVLGCNVKVTFRPSDGIGFGGLGRTVEGRYTEDGGWVPLRWLNGDDVQLRYDILNAIDEGFSSQGLKFAGDMPSVNKITLYRYH